jgi:methionyl-tRNA formyltransferase
MKLGLIGQKWLAAEVFKALAPSHQIAYVAAPSASDRLFAAAIEKGVPAIDYGATPLAACDLPAVDLIICAHAFVHIPESVRTTAAFAIGYHPSLLPLHKGKRSIEMTIAAGDPVTGGTVYHLTEELDAGPVVFQDWCFVQLGENAANLWRRALAPLGLDLLLKAVDHLNCYGFLPSEEQENLSICGTVGSIAPSSVELV